MDETTLNMAGIGSENKSNFDIVQLNKSWGSIIGNSDKLLFFAIWRAGRTLSVTFHGVDMLRVSDINGYLKDPDTSLFMLVAREEVEA